MRHNRTKHLVVGLLIFTLLLTGVYALLGGNLNITGTAGGAGDFKIEFSTYSVSDSDKATVTANGDKTTLNIDANLSYPGDSVTIDFTIKNTGSLRAIVDKLQINENSNDDIKINIVGLNSIEGTTLSVGETTNGTIIISWDVTSTTPEPESVTFDVTINYLQAT